MQPGRHRADVSEGYYEEYPGAVFRRAGHVPGEGESLNPTGIYAAKNPAEIRIINQSEYGQNGRTDPASGKPGMRVRARTARKRSCRILSG